MLVPIAGIPQERPRTPAPKLSTLNCFFALEAAFTAVRRAILCYVDSLLRRSASSLAHKRLLLCKCDTSRVLPCDASASRVAKPRRASTLEPVLRTVGSFDKAFSDVTCAVIGFPSSTHCREQRILLCARDTGHAVFFFQRLEAHLYTLSIYSESFLNLTACDTMRTLFEVFGCL